MYCRHCGSSADEQKKFCHECGGRLGDQANQAGSAQKKSSSFFKILLATIFAGLFVVIGIALFSEDATDTVSDQLKAIQQGKITEAYYNYTSKAFQEATSLEDFTTFIKSYVDFVNSTSVRFVDRSVDNETGVLQAMLMTGQGKEIPVQYSLVKEGNRWRIVSIKLDNSQMLEAQSNSQARPSNSEPFDSKPLVGVIEKQLEAIRQHRLAEAYEKYTSKSFRKATSFQDFEKFLQDQPGFANSKSSDIGNLAFENNVATLSGALKLGDGSSNAVEYDLVQEDGEWKILHIKVVSTDAADKGDASTTDPVDKVSKFVMGNAVDAKGLVSVPKSIFKSDSGDIYLNLYLTQVKAGTTIEVTFEHVDSGSSIAPVATRITEDGDSIATFIFSPPMTGWPKGNYRLKVSSAQRFMDSFDFKVEG